MINLADIQAGDVVRLANGNRVTVQSIENNYGMHAFLVCLTPPVYNPIYERIQEYLTYSPSGEWLRGHAHSNYSLDIIEVASGSRFASFLRKHNL